MGDVIVGERFDLTIEDGDVVRGSMGAFNVRFTVEDLSAASGGAGGAAP